jgi:hypothetical protein
MLLFYLLWFLLHQSHNLYTETFEFNHCCLFVSCQICVIIFKYLYALFCSGWFYWHWFLCCLPRSSASSRLHESWHLTS